MSETLFPVTLSLRIDWSELDYFGHVNNVSFFKYIQAARVNYWDRIGLTQSHLQTGVGPVLASCKCDFRKPLFYPGNVLIRSGVIFTGNTSFGIRHQLLDGTGELAAEAEDIIVMFDFNVSEKIKLSDALLRNINALETKQNS